MEQNRDKSMAIMTSILTHSGPTLWTLAGASDGSGDTGGVSTSGFILSLGTYGGSAPIRVREGRSE